MGYGNLLSAISSMERMMNEQSALTAAKADVPELGSVEDLRSIAADLVNGASADIWYDAHTYSDMEKESVIEQTQNAMNAASKILSVLGDVQAPKSVVKEYTSEGKMKPIRTENAFPEASSDVGILWRTLSEVENTLAQKLASQTIGTMVVFDQDAWFLREQGESLVLCHGVFANKQLTQVSSRFDFGLEMAEVKADDLQAYIDQVQLATEKFNLVLDIPEKSESHWLDKHIQEQAGHYGLTVEQKAKLFDGAADFDEMILTGMVDEPRSDRPRG